MRTFFKRTLLGLLLLVACVVLGAMAYLHYPRFDAMPNGERLERIQRGPGN